MNRADRRALKRRVQRAVKKGDGVKHPVPDSVVLRGGPMDGWIVKPNAPALRADWHETWPEAVAAANTPGRYVLDEGGKQARWEKS